jgi:hypothetical protein
MSQEKHYQGKLVPTGLTLEQWNPDIDHPCESDTEIAIVKGLVYLVEDKMDFSEDGDIFHITPNQDGSYDFEVKYYNGAMGFHEAIEIAEEDM